MIPVYQPWLCGNEKKYVMACLDSNWISSRGFFVEEFEKQFAAYTGVKHASAVANGTVALHLAMLALGIKDGDEVIVPTLTYIASVNAIAYARATPVFVDSLKETWQMDPADIEKKITAKTKAIMVVHLYGHPCDMDAIMAIAKKHNLYVIEDCAEATGSYYNGKHVGTFGDIATFSFYGNKTITTGEGGMVVTNDEKIHNHVLHYKGQGLAKGREYWHDVVGYNYRMTNICAAIGLAQLEQIEFFLSKKKELAKKYKEKLDHLPLAFHDPVGPIEHSYWMISILTERADDCEPLREFLKKRGIESRPFFRPAHKMPMYEECGGNFPVAERLSSCGINLPSWPGLTVTDLDVICADILQFYSRCNTVAQRGCCTDVKT